MVRVTQDTYCFDWNSYAVYTRIPYEVIGYCTGKVVRWPQGRTENTCCIDCIMLHMHGHAAFMREVACTAPGSMDPADTCSTHVGSLLSSSTTRCAHVLVLYPCTGTTGKLLLYY